MAFTRALDGIGKLALPPKFGRHDFPVRAADDRLGLVEGGLNLVVRELSRTNKNAFVCVGHKELIVSKLPPKIKDFFPLLCGSGHRKDVNFTIEPGGQEFPLNF